MKKLMIMLGAVAMAACVQAASMNWSTDMVADPSGNLAMGEGYISMYLFTINAETYTALTSGVADGDISSKVWGAYKGSLASANATYVEDGSMMFTLSDSAASYGAGDTAYGVFVMTYDTGDGVSYYKGNVGSYTFEADVHGTVGAMDTTVFGSNGSTALGWTAVPEPTSGLLMLVGLAGLALRRRRA